MQVLHIVDNLGIGGTERGLATVIERTRHGIAHGVCCLRELGPTAVRLEEQGIPIAVVGKTPGHDWSLPLRIARLCRQIRPDIVHTRNWGTVDGIIGARLAGVPVVVHGEHGRHATDPEGRNRRRNVTRRLLSRFVDRMVAVSDQLARWLIDDVGIAAEKVSVLKNGVDADQFQQRPDRATLRACHGYGPEDIVIGTVGRLDPVKNQAALVVATADLRRAHPQLRLVIAGDGPARDALQREIEDRRLQGVATLLGHRDDVPAVLNLFDIFVLPSVGEGMCNTILEAMAVGLPVVATCVGGNPELVVDGTTGTLVPPRDATALRAALGRYLVDAQLRRSHGLAGRTRVLEEFTVERMAQRYVELYEREAERKRCAA